MDLSTQGDNSLELILSKNKEIQFFEYDKYIQAKPKYLDPKWQELSDIINKDAYSIFTIDELSKDGIKSNPEEWVKLKGHYDTFDGIHINVWFEGKYGNPENHVWYDKPNDNDSFESYVLKASFDSEQYSNAQNLVLESIKLRDEYINFNNKELHHSHNFILGDFTEGQSKSGLETIRKVGKIVNLYNGFYTKDKFSETFNEYHYFKTRMNEEGFKGKIDFEISEFQSKMDELSFFHKKVLDSWYEFMAIISFKQYNSNQNSSTEIKYEIEDHKFEIGFASKQLDDYYTPSYQHDQDSSKESEQYLNDKRKLVRFIINCCAFRTVEDDFVEMSYVMHGDTCLLEAREKIKEDKNEYKPLAKTIDESNLIKLSYDYEMNVWATLNSLEEYKFMNTALNVISILDTDEYSIENLLLDDNIDNILKDNPELNNRVHDMKKIYFELGDDYQDAFRKYVSKDPALELANKIAEENYKKENKS